MNSIRKNLVTLKTRPFSSTIKDCVHLKQWRMHICTWAYAYMHVGVCIYARGRMYVCARVGKARLS